MRSRADLFPAEPKIEAFLTDLAVNGDSAAATQNRAMNALVFLEAVRLRVQDIDFQMKQLTVRSGKGDRNRFTTFPATLTPLLQNHSAGIRTTGLGGGRRCGVRTGRAGPRRSAAGSGMPGGRSVTLLRCRRPTIPCRLLRWRASVRRRPDP
jgi:integrase